MVRCEAAGNGCEAKKEGTANRREGSAGCEAEAGRGNDPDGHASEGSDAPAGNPIADNRRAYQTSHADAAEENQKTKSRRDDLRRAASDQADRAGLETDPRRVSLARVMHLARLA